MAIETNFTRYGHCQSGITGITLKPEIVITWAYGLHACMQQHRERLEWEQG